MRLCLYIQTADMRASTRRMLVPVGDVARVMFWRMALSALARIGLPARSLEDTCALTRWVWFRHLCAALTSRNLLAEINAHSVRGPMVSHSYAPVEGCTARAGWAPDSGGGDGAR